MVDLTFQARAKNFVPLSLLKRIASTSTAQPPSDVDYIGEDGVKAIKGVSSYSLPRRRVLQRKEMALINRGRLSVQRVEEQTWSVIEKLAETGGWDDGAAKGKKTEGKANKLTAGTSKKAKSKTQTDGGAEETEADAPKVKAVDSVETDATKVATKTTSRKRKAAGEVADPQPVRRSARTRK